MIRASSVPRLLACPASAVPPEHRYDPPSEASAAGTAAHAVFEALVRGSTAALDDLAAEAAAKAGADHDEVAHLARSVARCWRELEPQLAGYQLEAEAEVTGATTRGRADLVAYAPDEERRVIVDLKTGRVERDHSAQLGAYALAWADAYGMAADGVITTAVLWAREGRLDVRAWTPTDLAALRSRITDALAHPDTYAPGEACGYCPRRLECPAFAAYQRASVTALADATGAEVITPAMLAILYTRAKMLRDALDRYDTALRLALQAGPLDLGDGRELALVDRTIERIRPREAWGALEDAIGLDALSACVTISKSAAMKSVGDTAPRGEKGKAQAALAAKLRDLGAIETQTQTRVEARKKEQLT